MLHDRDEVKRLKLRQTLQGLWGDHRFTGRIPKPNLIGMGILRLSTPPILRTVSYGVPEPVSNGCMSGLRDLSDRFAPSRRTGTGRSATLQVKGRFADLKVPDRFERNTD